MKNDSLVSVIMPAYNPDNALLRKAIASIFSQTYPRIELVICDDGSSIHIDSYFPQLISDLDNSQGVTVKVVRADNNHGISSARNMAIANSSGDWLVWLDSDDTLESDCITNLMNESESYNLIIGECDVFENGTVSRRKPKPYFETAKIKIGTEEDPFLLNIISVQPQLIRKSELMEIGGFNEEYQYAELTELFLRYISLKGLEKVNFIENAVYCYNRCREITQSSNRNELLRYRLMALTQYKEKCNISSSELVYVGRDLQTGFQKYKLISQ